MNKERGIKRSIVAALALVGLTALFIAWAIHSPAQVQEFLIRLVVVSLIIFLGILLLRFFALLWFGYLQHAEADLTERPAAELPPVSVIVPAYNEEAVLDRAIESLLAMDYPTYEIIVVDDGSTDRTLEVARRWEGTGGGVDVRVFTKRNGGKARALNAGIGQARYPLILCMDADSWMEPQSMKAAMRHFEDPNVGAVAGNVKVENRKALFGRLQALEYIQGLNMPRRAQGFLGAVNIVPGPIGIFRKEALEEVGLYDTDTFAEDADLTMKLLTAGWKVVYEDQSITWTSAPENVLDLIQQRYRWTRGILQALGKRKRVLVEPFPDFPLWISTVQMAFEAIIWPILSVYGHLFFALVALLFGMSDLLLYWWALLTLLDVVTALISVAMEEEDLSFVPLALIYRFFFVLFLDVVKTFATLEQVLNLGMGWDKLRRAAYEPASADPVPQ
jgi:poly-beta-1,6-N-acetyl-D-glucosamine synthase